MLHPCTPDTSDNKSPTLQQHYSINSCCSNRPSWWILRERRPGSPSCVRRTPGPTTWIRGRPGGGRRLRWPKTLAPVSQKYSFQHKRTRDPPSRNVERGYMRNARQRRAHTHTPPSLGSYIKGLRSIFCFQPHGGLRRHVFIGQPISAVG